LKETNWVPERKILAGSIVAVAAWAAGLAFPDLDIPAEVAAGAVVIVGYMIPNKKSV
jgi:hypothetical protein